MPRVARDHLATLVSDPMSCQSFARKQVSKIELVQWETRSPGIMNSQLSLSPSAPDLMWTAVSLPLTGTAFLVASCTKLFLP